MSEKRGGVAEGGLLCVESSFNLTFMAWYSRGQRNARRYIKTDGVQGVW